MFSQLEYVCGHYIQNENIILRALMVRLMAKLHGIKLNTSYPRTKGCIIVIVAI